MIDVFTTILPYLILMVKINKAIKASLSSWYLMKCKKETSQPHTSSIQITNHFRIKINRITGHFYNSSSITINFNVLFKRIFRQHIENTFSFFKFYSIVFKRHCNNCQNTYKLPYLAK